MYKILFICTGNFYRSKFCEAFMENEGKVLKIPIRTMSRGFEISLADKVASIYGETSPYTIQRLDQLGIDCGKVKKRRTPVSQHDINSNDIIVIIDKAEHSPYMENFDFPENRTVFWEVKDIADWTAKETLDELEKSCHKLSFKLWGEYF